MKGRSARPNVLFITCDQWRGDSLGAAGNPSIRTPNIDALAREGVLFRRHYAGAAPCSPARACLYTGLYQMTNRVCRNGTPLDARHGNVALAARALGYDPTLFGYSDIAPDPRRHAPGDPLLKSYEGVLPGFSVRQLLPEHQKPWLSWLAQRGIDSSAGFPMIHTPAGGPDDDVTPAPPVYGADETPAAFLAGEFIRWMGEQDEPWFAHLSFLSPHPPFVVPEPWNTLHDPADGPAFARAASPEAEAAIHPLVALEIETQLRSKFLPGTKGKVADWSEASFRRIRAIYYGMIAEMDALMGRIRGALEKAGAWENTIFILTSDHAEMMGDHHLLGKGGFFDASYHIPLIVRAPAQAARGRVVYAFTETVDILPTIMDLLGAAPAPHLDGRSLAPFLHGETPAAWRDAVHWEYDFRSVAAGTSTQPFGLKPQQCNLAVLRTETLKYVHVGGGLPPVLFDLREDPAETRNVAQDDAYRGARIAMAERLLAWRAEHLDQSLALCELTEGGAVGHVADDMRGGWR
ncbi:MAG: alkaline phosphatase family protein [Rhizobiaceae bacterium]|nr:MAG: alkaline phosphatase family protein [Rhizobiaceae bacterium]CAG1013567.1 arylsulfatase [Rhizobiaceae bacterium]